MAAVSARSRGGAPNHRYAANPFDSDDDDYPTTSSTTSKSHNSTSSIAPRSSSGPQSIRYVNPFDDEPRSGGHVKSHAVAHGKSRSAGGDSLNPFDDDYSPPKPAKHTAAKGNKVTFADNWSNSDARDTSNPFDNDYEVTSKPTKSRSDTVLDNGSLFHDDNTVPIQEKERKTTTRAFAARIKESGTRIKETASSSLSGVKLPALPSASAFARQSDDKAADSKKGKAAQQSRDLFGEPQPVLQTSQHTYYPPPNETRFEDQTVEQLQQYAASKSQDTTSSIKNAIRIAEDTKGVATKTLETLHDQGEQIRRTHDTAVRVEEELGRGEKLLGTLGGMFSMTWKPKKGHKITGPQADPDHYKRRNHLGERGALGLTGESATRSRPNISGMSTAEAQLQMEKNTQDDALSDLSNVLGQLKGMTVEMGSEIDRQNGDLDRMQYDVQELNERVKGANNRTRHLLRR